MSGIFIDLKRNAFTKGMSAYDNYVIRRLVARSPTSSSTILEFVSWKSVRMPIGLLIKVFHHIFWLIIL